MEAATSICGNSSFIIMSAFGQNGKVIEAILPKQDGKHPWFGLKLVICFYSSCLNPDWKVCRMRGGSLLRPNCLRGCICVTK